MKIRLTIIAILLGSVFMYSCDGDEFNDSGLLSELDLLNQKVDSLAQVNNNLIDSLGNVTEDLDEALDNVDGFTGPLNMSAIGNWDDDDSTAFSLSRSFTIINGDKFNEVYAIDNGNGTYFINVSLNSESVSSNSSASFNFNVDVNSSELMISDFYSESSGWFNVNSFKESLWFSQEGYLNNGSQTDNVTIDGFNFNQQTLGLSIVFTVRDTEEEPNNSTDNPSTVSYSFNGFLVWGSNIR